MCAMEFAVETLYLPLFLPFSIFYVHETWTDCRNQRTNNSRRGRQKFILSCHDDHYSKRNRYASMWFILLLFFQTTVDFILSLVSFLFSPPSPLQTRCRFMATKQTKRSSSSSSSSSLLYCVLCSLLDDGR